MLSAEPFPLGFWISFHGELNEPLNEPNEPLNELNETLNEGSNEPKELNELKDPDQLDQLNELIPDQLDQLAE